MCLIRISEVWRGVAVFFEKGRVAIVMEDMEIDNVFADDPQFDGLPQFAEYAFDEAELDSFHQLSMVSEFVLNLCSSFKVYACSERNEEKRKRRLLCFLMACALGQRSVSASGRCIWMTLARTRAVVWQRRTAFERSARPRLKMLSSPCILCVARSKPSRGLSKRR